MFKVGDTVKIKGTATGPYTSINSRRDYRGRIGKISKIRDDLTYSYYVSFEEDEKSPYFLKHHIEIAYINPLVDYLMSL